MTTMSPILGFPEVDPNQTSKEATINTATVMLEAATQGSLAVDMSAGSVTLNATQWQTAMLYILTGATGAVTLSVPATVRHCAFQNTGTATITIEVTGGAGATITLLAGKIVLVFVDGTNVSPLSQGVATLAELTDCDITSPADGQIFQFDGASGKWKNVSVPGISLGRNTYTGNHTLGASDVNTVAKMNSSSATILTVPLNATFAWPVGQQVSVLGIGTGVVTIAPASGVTLLFPADVQSILRTQNSIATLVKTDTDEWTLVGDLLNL